MFRLIIRKWKWYFMQMPRRLERLWNHFNPEKWQLAYFNRLGLVLRWLLELIRYWVDLLGLPELLETFTLLIKFNSRLLNEDEREIGKNIFGDQLNLDLISIDEAAFFGPRQFRFAYVQLNTINFWGKMQRSHFVHELVHIWQYQQFGSVYALRALIAQRSRRAYDYGSEALVVEILKRGRRTDTFNYEQQAVIIADYYVKKYERKEADENLRTYALYLEKLLTSTT